MGLEWVDTWAGLAGFVAALAWLNGQHRQTRKQIDRVEASLKAEIHRFEANLKAKIDRFEANLKAKIDRFDARLKAEIRASEQR